MENSKNKQLIVMEFGISMFLTATLVKFLKGEINIKAFKSDE